MYVTVESAFISRANNDEVLVPISTLVLLLGVEHNGSVMKPK